MIEKWGAPDINSNKIAPIPYISEAFVVPSFDNISGLKYWGEPQNVLFGTFVVTFSLANPKSASFICPSESIKIFSGFKSR